MKNESVVALAKFFKTLNEGFSKALELEDKLRELRDYWLRESAIYAKALAEYFEILRRETLQQPELSQEIINILSKPETVNVELELDEDIIQNAVREAIQEGAIQVDLPDIAKRIINSNLRHTTKVALLYMLLVEQKPVFKTSIRKVQAQTNLSFSSAKRMFAELKKLGVIVEQDNDGSLIDLRKLEATT